MGQVLAAIRSRQFIVLNELRFYCICHVHIRPVELKIAEIHIPGLVTIKKELADFKERGQVGEKPRDSSVKRTRQSDKAAPKRHET